MVAAATSDKVELLLGEALKSLRLGFNDRGVDGFSVYGDRTIRYNDLNTALGAIRSAMDLIRETGWPPGADLSTADA